MQASNFDSPPKKRSRGRRAAKILLVVFALLVLGSGAYLIVTLRQLAQDEETFTSLAERVSAVEQTISATTEPTTSDEPENETAAPDEPGDATTEEIVDTAPVTVYDENGILLQYSELYAENPDLAGWLCIEGTSINYPFMYTPDDPEYYLRRNFNGESSRSGTPFLDGACTLNPDSDNLIIYGHNMRSNGTVFNELEEYSSYEFYQAHGIISLDTLTERREYQIFAAFRATVRSVDEVGFRYYNFREAADVAAYDDFVANVKALSYYDTGITPSYGDELLTLSTCSYFASNGRFAVVAVRIK